MQQTLYGLIGGKLGHSYSKIIHEQIADYTYDLLPLPTEAEARSFMQARAFTAINVTIPYKQLVIPYCDVVDPKAAAIGAVNTIVIRDGRLYGDNTDFAGMAALIRRIGVDMTGKRVLILGTGGTSRTAHAVAQSMGAAEIRHVSRSGRDGALTYEEAAARHGDAQVIINTTPCGMFPAVEDCPVALADYPMLEGAADAIYNPLRSNLILQARQRGIPAEGGLYMLAAQAAYASALFRGCEAAPQEIDTAFQTVRRQMENIVLIGMPGCGKTTMIRDLTRNISNRRLQVAVCDERSEIAGMYCGRTSFDLGSRTDVLDGCDKAYGIPMLIRSMAPDVIVTDEIGKTEDIRAVQQCLSTGVGLITTIHGSNLDEIESSAIGSLIREKVFKRIVFLTKEGGPGTIKEVLHA